MVNKYAYSLRNFTNDENSYRKVCTTIEWFDNSHCMEITYFVDDDRFGIRSSSTRTSPTEYFTLNYYLLFIYFPSHLQNVNVWLLFFLQETSDALGNISSSVLNITMPTNNVSKRSKDVINILNNNAFKIYF
jgi:hypothetical protein